MFQFLKGKKKRGEVLSPDSFAKQGLITANPFIRKVEFFEQTPDGTVWLVTTANGPFKITRPHEEDIYAVRKKLSYAITPDDVRKLNKRNKK